ncbi:Bacteriophage clamp loader A subunit [uncultured Caudovirales phage]|uniref:Bacteriophage clamp loader A subunit n=1 Tax=uncultured Caudovirales phage TaxID=2100421 RepID=A0A6J5M9D9_9CAUD|nr:Bacteriophage clamp loader A subunit [uncultured Caudovirales phage]
MAAKKLFDHLIALTAEQDPYYFNKLTEEDKKSWSNFMINRFLSMKPEWVELIASIQPLTQTLEPEQMYKLYINILPKGRQYLKYTKGKSEDKYEQFLVELIKKEYDCSERQAIEYIEVLYSTREGRENIQYICERYAVPKREIAKLKLKI